MSFKLELEEGTGVKVTELSFSLSTYNKNWGKNKKELVKVNKTLEDQGRKINSKEKESGANDVLEKSVTVRIEIRMLLNYIWQ